MTDRLKDTTLYNAICRVAGSGNLSVQDANELTRSGWRSWIELLPKEIQPAFESFFLFTQGFVEEVEEGFVDGENDPELAVRARELLGKLHDAQRGPSS